MNAALTGQTLWLTRPSHQSEPWADAIRAAGGHAVCEALLAIEPPRDAQAARLGLSAAADADIVIATSVNAVAGAWSLLADFAPRGALYGVGAATAQALAQASGRPVDQPTGCYRSEDLLALDTLAYPAGRRAVLLSGEGGRTTLADTLIERGADVTKVALYRRRPCVIPGERLAAIAAVTDATVITSGEALNQLERLLIEVAQTDTRQRILGGLLVAPSARVVKQSNTRLRWSRPPVIVDRVSADAVITALAQIWRGGRQ